MTLKRLFIQHLRNLGAVDITPSAQVNLIYGENGSGKTSILEAINVLGVGRSFRSHKHKPLINHHQTSFTVFGKVNAEGVEVPVGVNRQANGEAVFKANGMLVSSAAMLASYLPLQVINSDTFLLLEGSPKIRRQFMDWLVFHVEPGFFQVWKDAQRCLKHRNSLLRRDRMDRFELATWDKELAQYSHQIHVFRQECMRQFCETFYLLVQEFIAIEGVSLTYYCGWDEEKDYAAILADSVERDKRQGFTQVGSHRADLRITINGYPAAEVLSRGQQKLLVCALKIAQGYLFSKITGRRCIYLIDDLPAELDEHHRSLLVRWLDAMETQTFVTGVEKQALLDAWQELPATEIKLFHVEQGNVQAIV
ncbi:DNA replication/repair protein RecF [Cellvibrio sp. ARAG 10.3]|uniref:DNA replication/repair protein RecF n=1 Tax=Cellvibrio sp. ARAG 10.3 TaxID=3451358 RepID=UPI003F487F9B